MGNGLIAFLVAISASVWIFSKLMRSTGGNTQNAVTAAAISGVIIFVLVLLIARLIPT
jgi:hypothetical protein